MPKTREQQCTKRAASVTWTADRIASRREISARQYEITREHKPRKVPCTPAVRRSPKTPTRGQSAVQPGGDHAKHARIWVPRGDQGARYGNVAFCLLTHQLEGEHGKTGRDRNGLGKEEGDSKEPPMKMTRNREKTCGQAVTHELGQSQSRVSKERPQQGGKGGK